MKASIYDIATEANVSVATVSRVLNKNNTVSEKTRLAVEEAMRKLDYCKRGAGRAAANKTVGIFTFDISVPNFASTVRAIEREHYQLGFKSIICSAGEEEESGLDYLRMLAKKEVCGICCVGSVIHDLFSATPIMSELSHIPFILCNCRIDADNAYSVIIDDRKGADLCVKHLISKGHKDIVFVKDMDSLGVEERAAGFLNSMQISEIPVGEEAVFTTARSIDGGARAIDAIIKAGRSFSAVIFSGDLTAIGGIKRLQQLGYSVPGDVAVMGFNNMLVSQCCDPPLSTVDNKIDIIGSFSAKLMESIIEGKQTTRLLTVEPELILREST